jgi:diguanylate cyclase (GGDEF)-like protein
VRWVAVALQAVFAAVGPHPGVPRSPLLALAATVALYNAAVTWHERVPRLGIRTLTTLTVVGDFLWITAAVSILATVHNDFTAVIGYVVLGSECGLLLGWRGAMVAVAGGVGVLVSLDVAGLHATGSAVADVGAIGYQAGAVAVAGIFGSVGSSELRAQRCELVLKTRALEVHARTDHLTGLGNVRALEETLISLCGRSYGLLLIDIDRMRAANIVYGHEAGNEMLVAVARVVSSVTDVDDVGCRLAEDKFVVVLPGATTTRTAHVAKDVRAAVSTAAVSGAQLRVSIGCAWSPGEDDVAAAMERADDALYAAKARGGDQVVFQGEQVGGSRWRLRDAVESALESERGVYSVYQRIVHLGDRREVGWEALARPHEWPADSDVEAMFVTAHRMGRGRDLDWRCRRTALWEAARLSGALFVNINVSGLVDPVHGVDQMLLICEWAGRDPRSVVLELSERDAMPDLRRLRDVLADYRAAGFRFALDDLGQGQTTLEVVLAARPEFLKLARPLIQAARSDSASRSAARALVTFAHDIGSIVIAEGLEDEADLLLCTMLQIDLGQGWLFGRPLPADRLPS